jgi:ParB family chromosome partitioning protein
MHGLVESIRQNGIIQPVLVTRTEEGYQLIAGERRWRAAQEVGLATVPVIVRDTSPGPAGEQEILEIALVENIQREDLNPIDKGEGLRDYLSRFSLTQDAAARRLGQDRSTIANLVRLLELPKHVKEMVRKGQLTMGHGRALLGLTGPSAQTALAKRIPALGLSVRQVERIVRQGSRPRAREVAPGEKPAHIRQLEEELMQRLGTRVRIDEGRKKGHGQIIIQYYSFDDFDRILDKIQ